jgi:hypothetical protein
MSPLRHCLFAVTASACLAMSAPAPAALINYVFVPGSSACAGSGGGGECDPHESNKITIEGSFAFNTEWDAPEDFFPPPSLPNLNITLSGSPLSLIPTGTSLNSLTFTTGEGTANGTKSITLTKILPDIDLTIHVGMFFENDLNTLADGSRDPLTSFQISWEPVDSGLGFIEILSVDAAVVPVPEPTSLVLIAAALGLFFYGYQLKFVQR